MNVATIGNQVIMFYLKFWNVANPHCHYLNASVVPG